jgi:hypothetical protein
MPIIMETCGVTAGLALTVSVASRIGGRPGQRMAVCGERRKFSQAEGSGPGADGAGADFRARPDWTVSATLMVRPRRTARLGK